MRILLLGAFYAPHNEIASVRLSKFAEYWADAGHQVHVITREPTIPGLEEPESPRVTVKRIKDPLARAAASGTEQVRASASGSAKQVSLGILQSIARRALWPDRYVLWSLRTLLTRMKLPWKPDVVVVSVGPVSALAPALRLARAFDVPLVVDYRDLQSDRRGPDDPRVSPGRWMTSRFERGVTSHASLLTAVTDPMVELLGRRTGVPTALVTNGYEPRDFEDLGYSPATPRLVIRYVGTIYPGLRDPSPLFLAIRLLRDRGVELDIRVEFFGADSHEVRAAADNLGLSDCVTFLGRVSHAEAVRVQVEADILLLLFWDHPHEKGVLTGKLFEYIGARRPILCMGLDEGVGPDLVRDENLGFVSSDPEEIADFLLRSAREKRETGSVSYGGRLDPAEYTRETQSLRMLESLQQLVPNPKN